MSWRILKYIEHLFYRKYRKGHGIHSPYLFAFVNKVVFNSLQMQVPGSIQDEQRRLRQKSRFARRSSVSPKQGALLFRISQWFHPEMIIELGSGMGISTMFLASGSPGAALHTIEGDHQRAQLASGLMERCCTGSVSIHQGEMGEQLEEILPLIPGRFLAFVDGDHHYEPTLGYVRKLLDRAGDEAVIVMDDIYWSRGMYRAWKEIISWPEVRLSVDLFHMGILLLRRDLHKRQIKIKF